MIIRKAVALWIFLCFASVDATPLAEQFKQVGYLELRDEEHEAEAYKALYVYFNDL